MPYFKGRLDLLAQLVDKHQGEDKSAVLERMGGQLGLSSVDRDLVRQRLQRMGDRRFSMSVSAHGATHAAGRPHNEDAMLVDRHVRLFAVADGMGGERGGALAAATALQALRRHLAQGLDRAFLEANRAVIETGPRAGTPRMGCTMTALHLAANEVRLAWVGDSRVYRLRDDRLQQLTADDRMFRNVLSNVIGREPVEVHLAAEPAEPGTTYLLCTDGVTDALEDVVLRQLLTAGRKALPALPGRIVSAARAARTRDNATALVVRIG